MKEWFAVAVVVEMIAVVAVEVAETEMAGIVHKKD